MDRETEILVDKVEDVRKLNNRLWMNILRTAMETNPTYTKQILRQINEHDREISKLLGRIANEDQ